jgi:hypothetical protein
MFVFVVIFCSCNKPEMELYVYNAVLTLNIMSYFECVGVT